MKRMRLIGSDEGSFDYNRNVEFSSIAKREVSIQLHAELTCMENENIVSVSLFTRYLLEKDQLLNYRVSLMFEIEGWASFINEHKDEDILESDEVYRILAISVGFLRGSLSLQQKTTPLRGAFLPLINIEGLKKNANINRLKHTSKKTLD